MNSADSKLFVEIDKPESSKIVNEDNDKGVVERKSRSGDGTNQRIWALQAALKKI